MRDCMNSTSKDLPSNQASLFTRYKWSGFRFRVLEKCHQLFSIVSVLKGRVTKRNTLTQKGKKHLSPELYTTGKGTHKAQIMATKRPLGIPAWSISPIRIQFYEGGQDLTFRVFWDLDDNITGVALMSLVLIRVGGNILDTSNHRVVNY